jgi:hypothetical protein
LEKPEQVSDFAMDGNRNDTDYFVAVWVGNATEGSAELSGIKKLPHFVCIFYAFAVS